MNENWQIEFDKKYGCVCDDRDKPDHTRSTLCRGAFDTDELKAFIQNLITQAEKDADEKIRLLAESCYSAKQYDEGLRQAKAQGFKEAAEELTLYKWPLEMAIGDRLDFAEGYNQAVKDLEERKQSLLGKRGG